MGTRQLHTQGSFAKLAGVDASTVSSMTRGRLRPAMYGKKIDAAHPAAIKYLMARADASAFGERQVASHTGKPKPRGDLDPLADIPIDIRELAETMTLRELATQFGTSVSFGEWLKTLKELENVHRLRLDNSTKERELVSRDLVLRGIIGPVETVHLQLLNDGSKTMSREIDTRFKAGDTVEDIEKYLRGQIGTFIKSLKSKIKHAVRACNE